MARKPLTTSIDESVQQEFKDACKNSNLKMNEVLEALMKGYVEGKIVATTEVVISVNKAE